MRHIRKPLLLVFLSPVLASLFVGSLIFLGIGASEGGLDWASAATKEKIDAAVGILMSPGIVLHLGLAGVLLFYTIMFFIVLSLLLRRRPKRHG